MSLALDEQQRQLQESAESFFAGKAPVRALRKLRDDNDETGFSRELWQQMCHMGWTGTFLSEAYGGLGLGFKELGIVVQAAGRTLSASPLFSSIALGASCLSLVGSEAQKARLLPRLVNGEELAALALQERAHHDPASIATSATREGDAWLLSGCKCHVIDGHTADVLIVVARTSGSPRDEQGISLFLVEAGTPGVNVERRFMVDSRNMAQVTFDKVLLDADCLLGELNAGYTPLQMVLDRGNAVLSAEMLGSALEAFERTVGYLKQREQFGVLIGTFQALQHRAAQMFCELEMSRSVVMEALRCADESPRQLALAASRAKVQMSETLRLVTDESIQMHGGIGMTDEEEIGFFLKRARVVQQLLGDEHYHLNRFADLSDY
ncbi:MAG: acyl-CoA dehydrogenase family protein [Halioglobus sp.]